MNLFKYMKYTFNAYHEISECVKLIWKFVNGVWNISYCDFGNLTPQIQYICEIL